MTQPADVTPPAPTTIESDVAALESAATAYGDARAKLAASVGARDDASAKGAGVLAAAQQQATDIVSAAQKQVSDAVTAAQATVDADTAFSDAAHKTLDDLIAKVIADAKSEDPAPTVPAPAP